MQANTREKILAVAADRIRERGYAATTVDDLCAAAGVTKGAFFHHFESKQDLAITTADHWSAVTAEMFATADYHAPPDPLDRVLAYIAFRKAILLEDGTAFACLVGTMVQETWVSHPAIRDACERSISRHAASLVEDIALAKAAYAPDAAWTPESLALHTQAVLQGGFVLAKSRGNAAMAADSLDHLHRYIALLFGRPIES